MLTLFSHSINIGYKAPIYSKAFIFTALASLLTFVPPLLIAYRSQGFWQRVDTFLEQPEVHFRHNSMFLLKASSSNGSSLGWSTYKVFNSFIGSGLRIPLIKTIENDWNRDGKLDYIDFSIAFPLRPKEHIRSMELFMFFDVKLHKFPSVHMEGLIHLTSFCLDSETKGMFYVGDFNLVQKEAVRHRGRDTRFVETPLIDPYSHSPKNFDFSRILSDYQSRNLTMRLQNIYSSPLLSGEPHTFVIKLRVNFPEQRISYRPGFWQVLKWAWVQYLSILLIFIILFKTIKTFVFSNQVLPSIQKVPKFNDKFQ